MMVEQPRKHLFLHLIMMRVITGSFLLLAGRRTDSAVPQRVPCSVRRSGRACCRAFYLRFVKLMWDGFWQPVRQRVVVTLRCCTHGERCAAARAPVRPGKLFYIAHRQRRKKGIYCLPRRTKATLTGANSASHTDGLGPIASFNSPTGVQGWTTHQGHRTPEQQRQQEETPAAVTSPCSWSSQQ